MRQSIIKQLILAILFCLLTIYVAAISLNVKPARLSKLKVSNLLKKGDIAYRELKFAVAADYYESYLHNTDNLKDTVISRLTDCYLQMREYDQALVEYKRIDKTVNLEVCLEQKFKIAELFARKGEYEQASGLLSMVDGYKQKANAYNQKQMLDLMKKDSLNWRVNFLNINTSYREFSPCLVSKTLFFSSNKSLHIKKNANGWDGYNYSHLWKIDASKVDSASSKKNDNTVNKSEVKNRETQLADIYELGDTKPMNGIMSLFIRKPTMDADTNSIGSIVSGMNKIKFNAGVISIDKDSHVYFSSNYIKADKKGVNRTCLMEGVYSEAGVSKIKRISFGDVNSYSVMHPAVNRDGTFMVCSSDKVEGKGGYDLYYAQRSDNNQLWGGLIPLGDNINTIGNEVFPTITQNGYLYFSSDAMPGLGGLDIYRISLQDALSGKGEPEHLSYPVNSSSDDFGWTQDSTGVKGYFTSDRLNNNDDLYSFYYQESKSISNSTIQGFVVDRQTNDSIEGVTIFMLNKKDSLVTIAKSDKTGKFQFPIRNSGDVVIKAAKKGHTNDCLSMVTTVNSQLHDSIQKIPRNLLLDKYKKGYKWQLKNIHYDFDKSFIRADARPILDSLIRVLNVYPINVELGSHTDCRGSDKYNMVLSQRRADAAVAYLVKHGIDPKRIVAKGYGESQLLNKCADGIPCNKEAHQENRRTELKVLGYNISQPVTDEVDLDKFKQGQVFDKSELPENFFDKCK